MFIKCSKNQINYINNLFRNVKFIVYKNKQIIIIIKNSYFRDINIDKYNFKKKKCIYVININ